MIPPEKLFRGPKREVGVVDFRQITRSFYAKIELALGQGYEVELFRIDGDGQYSSVITADGTFVGQVDRALLQQVAAKAMQDYGVNLLHHAPSTVSVQNIDDTTIEHAHYPSRTYDGLEFVRKRQFYSGTDNTFSVAWIARKVS